MALHLRRQRVVLGLVEHDLELLGVLVVALQHAHLGHVREAQQRSEVMLLNSAASSRPRSIAGTISPPGSALTAAPIAGEHVDRDAHGAVLEALEVVGLGDRLLEPAERLRRHRTVGERHARWRRSTRRASSSSSLPPPYWCQDSSMLASMPNAGTGTPQRQRVLLAVVVDEHAMAAVERALATPRRAGRRPAPPRRPAAPRS